MINKDVFNTDEVAEYLGVSRDVIYSMIQKRQIPHTRIGSRKYIFLKSSINNWLCKKEKETMREVK